MTAKQILKICAKKQADQLHTIGMFYDLWRAGQDRHEHIEKCVDLLIECIKDQMIEGRDHLEALQNIVKRPPLDSATLSKFDSLITLARDQAEAKNLEIRAMLEELPDDEG